MILSDGICVFKRRTNSAAAGEQPAYTLTEYYRSWFGELAAEISNIPETDIQGTPVIVRRIRVISSSDITVGHAAAIDGTTYAVTRIFRGVDTESGMLICDVTLEVPEYGIIV